MSVYEFHKMNDPELPFIFHQNISKRSLVNRTNWHENLEIICVTRGEGSVILDSRKINVEAGDTVLINANTIHGFITAEEFSYSCLIVDRSFCVSNHFDTSKMIFKEHFYDINVNKMIDRIKSEWNLPKSTPYRPQAVRAEVLGLMAYLCRNYGEANDAEKSDTRLYRCIKQAIGYINSECSRDLSLDEVCRFVGLSKYYFAREFHKITGYTFVAYLNMARCEKAKSILSEGDADVGEVGRLCGFSDQSYFTRVFKQQTGMSPSKYAQYKKSSKK